jgi:hypothetical protein
MDSSLLEILKLNVLGERLYIDISSIKERSFGGANFWALIVDH